MSGEIKSAVDLAQGHVDAIAEAANGFDLNSIPTQGAQRNSPTDAMRSAFESMNTMCINLESSLSGDAGNIVVMAEEFETWDQSGVVD